MFSNSNLRTRRHSGSFSPLASPHTANSCGPRAPRVTQLRAEECADATRELAHEREVHCAMQLGQSCEDLTLPGLANSPTRVTRFPPVVSPSPTRKYTTRRSLSPIAIRASSFSPVGRGGALAGKRRCDEPDSPLPKRMCTDRLTPSTPGTPDSDSLECTFRPVSPRAQPMNDSPNDSHQNHKSTNPS
ncbi:P2R1A-PPP2R2A-interacting phosphatase regulator 1 isoform X2 [Choristoneura fumiferana]